MKKAVIFDLDGTLAYTAPDMLSALNEACSICGFKELTLDDLHAYINFAPWEFVIGPLPPDTPEEKKREYFETYCRLYSGKWRTAYTPLYPGMYELLTELKARGIKTAVLTNKACDDARAICEKDAPGLLDYVLGVTPELPNKPDPAMAQKVLHELGVSADEVLYVGDSDVDVATAKNAGFQGAFVTWGYRSREHLLSLGAGCLVDSADELLKLALD